MVGGYGQKVRTFWLEFEEEGVLREVGEYLPVNQIKCKNLIRKEA